VTTPASDFCPYVGLRPFTVEERAFFFGRPSETRIITANLFAAPLTVFYGTSAVGKSSVLQAGVIPQLGKEPKTAVLYFRQWQTDDYLARLKAESRAAIEHADGKTLDIDDSLPFDRWIEQALEQFRGQLHVLLDQFEEYLLYHADPSPSSFDAELAAAINRRNVGARFLIALRDDGLAKLDRFRKRIPNLLGNTLRLQRLSVSAAKEAIEGPLGVYNKRLAPGQPPVTIEAALVEGVLAQVRADQVSTGAGVGKGQVQSAGASDEIETAYLQLVMERLWRERTTVNSHQEMRRETLDRLGGAKAIAQQHFDEHLDRLAQEGTDVGDMVVDLFAYLVTPTGTKISQKEEDLIALTKTPAARVKWFLGELVKSRLIRVTDPPERYEIFHDALAKPFLDSRNALVLKRATEAQEAEVKRVQALADAERARAESEARRVVEQRAAARKFKLVAIGALALAVVASVAGGLAVWFAMQAQASASEARRLQGVAQEAEGQASAAAERFDNLQKETSALSQTQQARISELIKELGDTQTLSDAERKRLSALSAENLANQKKLDTLNRSATDIRQSTGDLKSLRDERDQAVSRISTLDSQLKTALQDIKNLTTQRDAAQADVKRLTEEVRLSRADIDRLNAELAKRPRGDTKEPVPPPSEIPTQPGGDFRTLYRDAINMFDRRQWKQAATGFAAAAQLQDDSADSIAIGSRRVPYLPSFYLGQAYQQLGQCSQAIQAWDRAEKIGVVQKNSAAYKALQDGRTACQGKY
jgi:hypothetical protein